MKKFSLILNIVFALAIGVLFYMQFCNKQCATGNVANAKVKDSSGAFKIAYFDIDTLQKYYQYYQDAETQMKSKESSSRDQLNSLSMSYQRRLGELQQKASGMTQAEGEAAQRELANLEKQFQQKQLELDQELKKKQMDYLNELHEKVEDYLKDYNKDQKFAYIFSYQPGVLIYFKDSAYDISREMIDGLNDLYKKEKK